MSYVDVAGITSEFKNIDFTATGAVLSTDEVTQFILETSAVIDSRLSSRYVTPITGTISLLIVRKICIDFVAFRVAKILNLKKSLPLPEKLIVQELNEGSAYVESRNMLDSLQNGSVTLPDAVRVATTETGLSSYNTTNSITPTFKRSTYQW